MRRKALALIAALGLLAPAPSRAGGPAVGGEAQGGGSGALIPSIHVDASTAGAVDDATRAPATAKTTRRRLQTSIDALKTMQAADYANGQGTYRYDLRIDARKAYFVDRSLMIDGPFLNLVGDGPGSNLGTTFYNCHPVAYFGVKRSDSALTLANLPTLSGVLDSTATTAPNGQTRRGLLLGGTVGAHFAPEFSAFSLGTAPGIKGPTWGRWANENQATISFGLDLGSAGIPAGGYPVLGQVGPNGYPEWFAWYSNGIYFRDSAGGYWYTGESDLAALRGVVEIEYRVNLAAATLIRSIGTKATAGAATTWGTPTTLAVFPGAGPLAGSDAWDVGHVGGRTFAEVEAATHGVGSPGGTVYAHSGIPAPGLKLLYYHITNTAPTIGAQAPPATDAYFFDTTNTHLIACLPLDDDPADVLADLQVGVANGVGATGSFAGTVRGNGLFRSPAHDLPDPAIAGVGMARMSARTNGSFGVAVAQGTTLDACYRDVTIHGGAAGLSINGNVGYTTRIEGTSLFGGAYTGVHQVSESAIIKQTGVMQIDAWGHAAIYSPYNGGWDLDALYILGVPPAGRYFADIDGSLRAALLIVDGETDSGSMRAGIRVRPGPRAVGPLSYCHLGRVGLNGLGSTAPAIRLGRSLDDGVGAPGTPASFRLESLSVYGAAAIPELIEVQSSRWAGAITCPTVVDAAVTPAMRFTGATGTNGVTWLDTLNYAGRPAAGIYFERGYTIRPNVVVAAATLTGTATLTAGSTAVVGAGTGWTSALVGTYLAGPVDPTPYRVASVTDTTHLTLASPAAMSASGVAMTTCPLLETRCVTPGAPGVAAWRDTVQTPSLTGN